MASRYDRNLEGDADDYSLAEIFAPDPGFTIKPVAPIGFEVVG